MTSFLVVAISRSGLCYFLSKRGVQVGRLRTMGVPIYFPVNITASEVLPQYHRQITIYFTIILVHLTGQRIVLAVKNYIDGIRYLDISPKKSGYRYYYYLDISYLVISHDMGHDTTIHLAIRRQTGSTRNTRQLQIQRKLTASLRCSLVFSALPLHSSWLLLRRVFAVVLLLSITWTHHRADRTTSKQQPRPLRTRPAP